MKKIIVYTSIFALIALGAGIATIKILNSRAYNFSAISSNGEVKLSDFNGQYKILYFGYTFCPDVCPLSLHTLNEALGDTGILLLFITLDPKRDTAQNLDEYAKFFYKNSIGLWMDESQLRAVASHFGIKYEEIELQEDYYFIAHSSAVFVLDKNGNLIETITNLTKENIRDLVTRAINE